jgi:hypothetical protein
MTAAGGGIVPLMLQPEEVFFGIGARNRPVFDSDLCFCKYPYPPLDAAYPPTEPLNNQVWYFEPAAMGTSTVPVATINLGGGGDNSPGSGILIIHNEAFEDHGGTWVTLQGEFVGLIIADNLVLDPGVTITGAVVVLDPANGTIIASPTHDAYQGAYINYSEEVLLELPELLGFNDGPAEVNVLGWTDNQNSNSGRLS